MTRRTYNSVLVARTNNPPPSALAASQRLLARGIFIVIGAVMVSVVLGVAGAQTRAAGEKPTSTLVLAGQLDDTLGVLLDSTRQALINTQRELDRAKALILYSSRFNIAADMAALIYDTAVEERIDPEIGFRLIKVESGFNSRAVSSAGALGLAQVLPNTARYFVPDLDDHQLFDRALNLRIGFRYLHDLIVTFEGDLPLALTAYNRGPSRLRQLLAGGIPPWNGYASSVLNGLGDFGAVAGESESPGSP